MDPRRPAAIVLAALVLLAGCGDDEGTTVADEATTAAPQPATGTAVPAPEPESRPTLDASAEKPKPDPKPKPEPSDAEKQSASDEATAAYSAYIDAIEAKDGGALCALLPPGVERELKPQVERGDCASTLEASIGYADPRGFPVWTGTTLNEVVRVSIGDDPSTARLTAMIVTDFEGREPSVESDIAYLERVGGRWRLAQPTGALYRAIGNPELPPEVIAPPPG